MSIRVNTSSIHPTAPWLSKSKTLLFWLISLGILVQISGYVWISSGSGRNTQIYIFLLLPALLILVAQLINKNATRSVNWYALPWLLFIAWTALSTLWATDSSVGQINLAKRGLFVILYLVGINFLMTQNQKFLHRLLLTAMAIVALGAMVSLVNQLIILDNSLAYRAFRIYRSGIGNLADYGWPVVAGIFHGSVAIWVFGTILDKKTSPRMAFALLCLLFTLIFYVALTYSRGAWISLAAASLLSIILQNTRRGYYLAAAGIITLIILSILGWDRLIFEIQERKLSNRGQIWEYFLNVMDGHWIAGYGLGTPFRYIWPDGQTISPHAHSLYLQQIYDSGIVGLSLLLLGVTTILHKSWKLRKNPWIKLVFPVFIFGLIAALTDIERIFTRPNIYWTVFWLPVGILLAAKPCKEDPAN